MEWCIQPGSISFHSSTFFIHSSAHCAIILGDHPLCQVFPHLRNTPDNCSDGPALLDTCFCYCFFLSFKGCAGTVIIVAQCLYEHLIGT